MSDYREAVASLSLVMNDVGSPHVTVSLSALASADQDGDGHDAADAAGDDCNDADASVVPGGQETWYDGIDSDCAGNDDFDQDGDGYSQDEDCDDLDAAVSPSAIEVCDETDLDENCNRAADDADGTVELSSKATFWADADGDGYGSAGAAVLACDQPTGTVGSADDCDDAASWVYPGANELVANGVDEDCDGVDACYTDTDDDNYGTPAVADGSTLDCTTGTGAPVATDCDDGDADVNPGAAEICDDGVDLNCDDFDGGACPLANADAKYTGAAATDQAGSAVSGAGDINAAGFDDLLIGSVFSDAYLVLGPGM